ncbi:MAG: cysteine-rich CWC family protein [Rhodoferax sp.]
MNSPDAALDPSRCPVCGKPNECAMEVERVTGITQPPCWCTQVAFPPSLLERVPMPAQGRACICQACTSGLTQQT